VLSALLVGERRRRISAELIRAFLDDLAKLPVSLDSTDLETVFGTVQGLSRLHGLTPYDAAYLELATRRGLSIATLDQDLARASVMSGVAVVR
jgi:predicted nucleic acid-binding protein